MTDLLRAAAIHACIYFLLACCPFVLFHWKRRLFLGSMGISAVIAYAACKLAYEIGNTVGHVTGLLLVILSGPILVCGITALMAGRSAFAWAVTTYATELFFLRFAATSNAFTNGELGVVSPFAAPKNFTLAVGIASVLVWVMVVRALVRNGRLQAAERYLESPRIAAMFQISFWEAQLVPAVLGGFGLSLATLLFLMWIPQVQPAAFGLCSSLVALTAALIPQTPQMTFLFLFAFGIVAIRIVTGLIIDADSTLVAETMAGALIIAMCTARALAPRSHRGVS